MRLLVTALACLISVSITAQEQVITYPYNPDADTDSLIAVPDMLDLLVLFGTEFIPEPVTVDGVYITEWLESASNQCCDSLSAVIDSMQVVLENIESNSGGGGVSVSNIGDTLTLNGESILIPGISCLNSSGSVIDGSGNIYATCDYGEAGIWMVEDLKTSNWSNGDEITSEDGEFITNTDSYAYEKNLAYDSRNICPLGWHIPSRQEWYNLIMLFSNLEGSSPTFCQNTSVSPPVNWYNQHDDLLSTGWNNYYANISCFNIALNPSSIFPSSGSEMRYFTNEIAPYSCFVFTSDPAYNQSTSTFQININEQSIGTGYVYTKSDETPYKLCVRCIKD